ncbi:hypothetical protein PR048_006071 [Dryococelus australis]|uniref:Uncharacterized protein n=1 Tax=Dryococelus australis TaxID=614101 RepID=A0ABQ9I9Y8_9NEOP|nr:hypothetical protein PR048_006071 [Dryococelus australis]
MLLVGGFSRESPPPPPFHSGAAPFSSALKTSLLIIAKIFQLNSWHARKPETDLSRIPRTPAARARETSSRVNKLLSANHSSETDSHANVNIRKLPRHDVAMEPTF